MLATVFCSSSLLKFVEYRSLRPVAILFVKGCRPRPGSGIDRLYLPSLGTTEAYWLLQSTVRPVFATHHQGACDGFRLRMCRIVTSMSATAYYSGYPVWPHLDSIRVPRSLIRPESESPCHAFTLCNSALNKSPLSKFVFTSFQ